MRLSLKLGIGVAALAALAAPALASGDYTCTQGWSLGPPVDENCGNAAILNPDNDTRINLFLLQRNTAGTLARPLGYPKIEWANLSFGHSFFDWQALVRTYAEVQQAVASYGSRCDSMAAGSDAFGAALAASKGLPATERDALTEARKRLTFACPYMGDEPEPEPGAAPPWPATLASATGKAFLGYLQASEAFYQGSWDAARQGYADLLKAGEPWVAETASYMLIRVDINAAQETAFDDYGDFAGAAKTDAAAVARTKAAIAAYLKRYPAGLYAGSARGLTRRALWLAGDQAALAAEYERLLAQGGTDAAATATLIQEIDNKLLFADGAASAIQTPQLLAAFDLLQMRASTEPDHAPLTAAQIAAQKDRFAGQPQLHAYLAAAQAFYVDKDYRRALALVPASDAASLTPLAFSQQMLRGMALAALRDPQEKPQWLSLIARATAPYQRELAELGLALAWQREGRIDQVFASGSPVQDATIREILLSRIASPALLRKVAADATLTQRMRDVASFALLHKDLATGRFADFRSDRALISAGATTEGYLSDYPFVESIALGLFRDDKRSEDFACPGLFRTADMLAANAADAHAQLCLADFWRLNGFDHFTGTDPVADKNALGAAPGQFPGKMMTRASIYAAVLANARAAADDKAYALYRSVYCYAPSGNNDCGGEDVDVSQRRAWFQQLKKTYPQSRWAKKLTVYW